MKPHPCPECKKEPTIRHDPYFVDIVCRDCYDCELLDGQWVQYGRHVSVTIAPTGKDAWKEAEEKAILHWNENIEDTND